MPSVQEYTPYHSVGIDEALSRNKAGARKSKLIVIGSLVALLALIAIGVGVGVTVAKNNSKNNTRASSSSSSNGGSSNSTNGPKQTDPNDPSTFVKDPNLHQVFYGMAYTPEGSQVNEGCSNKLEEVIKDIQLISQLTTRIRLYGADCNQSAVVLEAIKRTKVDMQVYLGNYVTPAEVDAYSRQRDVIKSALETYGVDHVAGVTVGNEFMLNYVNANGGAEPNSDIGNTGAQQLLDDIADTRSMLAGLNLPKTIQVGNSDAGSFFNTKVLEAVDYGLSNVHAWFANVSVETASKWTTDFFTDTNVAAAAALPNKPKMYIAETGWPTKSSDAGNASNGASTASEAGLQTFMDTFVCQANAANIPYFFFEFFDEPWKDRQFGGVEGYWGLFNHDRTLKNIKIPTCT